MDSFIIACGLLFIIALLICLVCFIKGAWIASQIKQRHFDNAQRMLKLIRVLGDDEAINVSVKEEIQYRKFKVEAEIPSRFVKNQSNTTDIGFSCPGCHTLLPHLKIKQKIKCPKCKLVTARLDYYTDYVWR